MDPRSRALSIPELLELILVYSKTHSIVAAALLCKHWRDLIQGSVKLNRRLGVDDLHFEPGFNVNVNTTWHFHNTDAACRFVLYRLPQSNLELRILVTKSESGDVLWHISVLEQFYRAGSDQATLSAFYLMRRISDGEVACKLQVPMSRFPVQT